MSLETPYHKVWILASPEILKELQEGWSRPVQAHASLNPGGSWEMTFRTAEGAEIRVIEAARHIAETEPWHDADVRDLKEALAEYDSLINAEGNP